MTSSENAVPRDAKVISLILRSLGIEECEPKVIIQILEFAYKYTVDVLEDSQLYAEHSDRQTIATSDVKLALQTKIGKYFVSPTPRQYMNELSASINSRPLSEIESENLLRVPNIKNAFVNLDYEVLEKDSEKKRRIL